VDALFAELAVLREVDHVVDARAERVRAGLRDVASGERLARLWVEELAQLLSASVLLRGAPSFVSDAYIQTRLRGERGAEYGSVTAELDTVRLLERALP
jgi:putative acyl-CoA dehydrogenase